jgi:pimeloyl-ACP methyl ester carboxylesterase
MDRVAQKRSGTVAVAGAELYFEVQGRGPAVLLIAGATGDAGHFEQAADVLASEHTVITYDRRGNSRSGPTGPTTLDQQADDAAALLGHVGAAAAAVFGTSGGAIIALKLAIRAAEVARYVIVHEPPFIQVLPDAAELGRTFQAQVEHALATRGVSGAMELFIRENAGSDTFDRLDPALRERMIANGPSFFGHELAMFMSWIPSETELAGLRVPVRTYARRPGSPRPLLPSRGRVACAGTRRQPG